MKNLKNTNGITRIALLIIFIIIISIIFIIIKVSVNKLGKNRIIKADLTYINNLENTTSNEPKQIEKSNSEDIRVVATLEDEITTNSAWCGTLQLVWNDMIRNVVNQNVVFSPQSKTVENLNRQTFTGDQLSEKDYYKVYDLLTLDLKKKIEKAIKSKFNEKSEILDKIDWSKVPKDNSGYNSEFKKYLFYAMLKKQFEFKNKFDELENSSFGIKYKDIKYFGIDEKSNSKLYSQVDILYYNSEKDFAIVLNTKEGEQVILARGTKGNSFGTIYNSIVKETKNYNGDKKFTGNDYLKIPNIKFNTYKNFDELCNKKFYSKDNSECSIEEALQTIEVELDRKGGKIKSEAAIGMTMTTAIAEPVIQYRYFYLNDEFVMFLKEADKEVPYFAANIENITLFQK